MRNFAGWIRRLRRGSPPHEITVFLPVFVILVVAHKVETSAISLRLGLLFSIPACAMSGVYLGLAWKNAQPFAVALRALYMGILVAAGYALTKNPSNMTKENFVHIGTTAAQTFGAIFYLGWTVGIIIQRVADNILYPNRRIAPVRSLPALMGRTTLRSIVGWAIIPFWWIARKVYGVLLDAYPPDGTGRSLLKRMRANAVRSFFTYNGARAILKDALILIGVIWALVALAFHRFPFR